MHHRPGRPLPIPYFVKPEHLMVNTSAPPARRGLNIGLWIAQAFVAVAFTAIGVIKLSTPIPQLAAMWPWTGEFASYAVRALGIIDIAGGLGILLPGALRIAPGLGVLAAAGCVALQVCAIAFHASRAEFPALPVNVILIACCVFVLWGRWKKLPIAPRGAAV